MLSDLKKLSMLRTKGINLTSQLLIKDSTNFSYIESKVVEIIDSQVCFTFSLKNCTSLCILQFYL